MEIFTHEALVMIHFIALAQESLSKLRVQRQVGVLILEGRQLRDELQPAPWEWGTKLGV